MDLLKRTKAVDIALSRAHLTPGDYQSGRRRRRPHRGGLKQWRTLRRGSQVVGDEVGGWSVQTFPVRVPTINGHFNVSEALTSSKMHLCTLFVNCQLSIDGPSSILSCSTGRTLSCRETGSWTVTWTPCCAMIRVSFRAFFSWRAAACAKAALRGACALKLLRRSKGDNREGGRGVG